MVVMVEFVIVTVVTDSTSTLQTLDVFGWNSDVAFFWEETGLTDCQGKRTMWLLSVPIKGFRHAAMVVFPLLGHFLFHLPPLKDRTDDKIACGGRAGEDKTQPRLYLEQSKGLSSRKLSSFFTLLLLFLFVWCDCMLACLCVFRQRKGKRKTSSRLCLFQIILLVI